MVATVEFLELHCHARTRQVLGGGLPGQLDVGAEFAPAREAPRSLIGMLPGL